MAHSEDLWSLLSHGSHCRVLPRKTLFSSGYVQSASRLSGALPLSYPSLGEQMEEIDESNCNKNWLHNMLWSKADKVCVVLGPTLSKDGATQRPGCHHGKERQACCHAGSQAGPWPCWVSYPTSYASCHANAYSAAATPLKPVVKLQAGEKPAHSKVWEGRHIPEAPQ